MEIKPLVVLLRIYVYALPLFIFFHPPELQFSLRQAENCPRVSLAYHTEHLGRHSDGECGCVNLY